MENEKEDNTKGPLKVYLIRDPSIRRLEDNINSRIEEMVGQGCEIVDIKPLGGTIWTTWKVLIIYRKVK